MTPYEQELSKIGETVGTATTTDIKKLKIAIAAASEASIIAVGSGGSFTVASLLCSLHEAFTGRVSRAVTPLELICNPTLASTSPIFIVSAEGKNPDILEALHRARQHSSRTVHVITNRQQSPLMEQVKELNDVTPHVFELKEKDGYLATNSLVFDATLIARTYGELDRQGVSIDCRVDQIAFGELSLEDWLQSSALFIDETAKRGSLIIVFSPNLRPIVEDLESKLSEAALLFCQLADFRSFAHGRHLWLTERSNDSSLLVLTEPAVEKLWTDMSPQIPLEVPTFCMPLSGAKPKDLISGLIAGMHLVSELANAAKRNIAKPTVSPLGRSLYYANLQSLIPPPLEDTLRGEISKYEVLGAHWPSSRNSGKIRRALEDTELAFETQKFRSIVFDYDGTLCNSNDNDRPPSPQIVDHLIRLLERNVVVGIASGRGGSMADNLTKVFDQSHWPKIRLGLYNGGWVGKLGERPPEAERLSEFLIHAKRIVTNLQSYGVPIAIIKATAPFQLSIRFEAGVSTESMWFVIVDAFKQAGLETSTIVRSKHSIDVLSRGVSKSHLVAQIVRDEQIDPYEIVTMGDLGAWPGNDASLLQHKFSLSVDLPSRRLDRGWKLAPRHRRDVDATLWYLERLKLDEDGTFSFALAGGPL
ncbi:HAD hydrolase family protein [Bradyrhizobium sp. BRP22]|uniref:HAD hydrolase family protein n=1 Tax=Bradyrhizobium sp. BRP22 TaxID=2793821 RepID=UPI001CD5D363|nr:HAD hydrolase family protein [Bradyrhizobium sp. BRP22]MCA1457601.1 HAD hydrolase family protein [Bradyrhizobium sp. BRP22]